LFQLREVKELDTSLHIPPRCTFYFNNDDEFMGIPTFLNPLYESSFHYDDFISERKIATDDMMMYDEYIDLIETLNLKPQIFNPIDAFRVRCKTSCWLACLGGW
jgi:hypothetical protein